MDMHKQFEFLVKDYGLSYSYQEFHNCYGGNTTVFTYSFYNGSGCFTIHEMPVRGELDFYFSRHYSTVQQELYEKIIDISTMEADIWRRRTKILFFNNPFFWNDKNKVLSLLAEVLKIHIAKYNEFFGIKIERG